MAFSQFQLGRTFSKVHNCVKYQQATPPTPSLCDSSFHIQLQVTLCRRRATLLHTNNHIRSDFCYNVFCEILTFCLRVFNFFKYASARVCMWVRNFSLLSAVKCRNVRLRNDKWLYRLLVEACRRAFVLRFSLVERKQKTLPVCAYVISSRCVCVRVCACVRVCHVSSIVIAVGCLLSLLYSSPLSCAYMYECIMYMYVYTLICM